ncbi:hypothetical protein [Rhodopseudomonas palustris]|uniref:Uncharacterized protein n=1 Tax=Rhodopseudomonas palustris (strain BisB18) TaxID=316056 RepID=Q21D23_RHOPB
MRVTFPIVLRDGLSEQLTKRWSTEYLAPSDRDRTREDGIWRRTQTPANATESGWRDTSDQRRRIVHYTHHYDVVAGERGGTLVLKSAYIYFSTSLPKLELNFCQNQVEASLSAGGWRRRDSFAAHQTWILGDLICSMERIDRHPEDIKARRVMPENYQTLDVRIRSQPYVPVPERLPWEVLAKGMRVKDVRGRPDIVSDLSGLAEYLPFHVELGCGPSLESGIPALHHLHDLYCVTDLQTGKFIFGGTEDNLIARILEQPFDELKSLTKLFQASFLAEPAPAHHALVTLKEGGVLVAPVMTNNFDGLAHRVGLPELFLRRYDETIPPISISPEARSLLVIGSHADRRRVQARARAAGLKVFYLDPEGYNVGDRFIEYPLESVTDQDLLCRKGASEGLVELCAILGVSQARRLSPA